MMSNPYVDEMKSYLTDTDDDIVHYGKGHLDGGKSGRYPWGSGDNPYQRSLDFMDRVDSLRKDKVTFVDDQGKKWTGDNAIAKTLGMTIADFRRELSISKDERQMYRNVMVEKMMKEGKNKSEIAREFGVNESVVRSWIANKENSKIMLSKNTADILKKRMDEANLTMLDVGPGTAERLNIPQNKLDTAIQLLKRDGYNLYTGGINQLTNPNQQTNQKVLCKPGVEHKDIYDFSKVGTIEDYISQDNGETYHKKFTYPASLDSKRLMVRFAEDGGVEKDGLIEVRRGVPDISLGTDRYAQVRVLVDGKRYLKGMCVYSDGSDMPPGIDVIFNTNKKKANTSKMDALKPIKEDSDNPFGSTIKEGGQLWYDDPKTGEKKLGVINKTRSEGEWSDWKDALPSQFLGKQNIELAKKQLNLAKADSLSEFNEIMSLTNPTIKKYYLNKFADGADADAVNLKAAALPGQKYKVMIPINSLSDNEVYAPSYPDGSKLALVRYPHGGLFEIPILTVNNRNKLARSVLPPDVEDAVGLNKKNADRLSGADFDGDTVMCIPTGNPKTKIKISNADPLKELQDFDSKMYKYDSKTVDKDGTEHYYKNGLEFKPMSESFKQKQMGIVSNLITDMTLGGATEDELARAVKHSMVVIDAVKHGLDYKQSEADNDILSLKKKYQAKEGENGRTKYGASTLLSRAKGETTVLKRQGSPKPNIKGKPWYDPTKPEGSLVYSLADDLYRVQAKTDNKTGIRSVKTTDGRTISYDVNDPAARAKYAAVKVLDPTTKQVIGYKSKDGTLDYAMETRTQKSTNMAETNDANSLVSSHKWAMELVYADYANYMKDLANKARIESANAGRIAYSKTAKEKYASEVESLNHKLNIAVQNKPKEREALRRANLEVDAKLQANPNLTGSEIKKLKQQAVTKYREEVSSVKRKERSIQINDKEWEAIQAGAITESILSKILSNSDPDSLRQKAMPKEQAVITSNQVARVKAYRDAGQTLDQIAERLHISKSSVSRILKEGA